MDCRVPLISLLEFFQITGVFKVPPQIQILLCNIKINTAIREQTTVPVIGAQSVGGRRKHKLSNAEGHIYTRERRRSNVTVYIALDCRGLLPAISCGTKMHLWDRNILKRTYSAAHKHKEQLMYCRKHAVLGWNAVHQSGQRLT